MSEHSNVTRNEDIESLERLLASASGAAFAAARTQVLASGLSLLQSEGGAVYEVFPDGRRRFVKAIEPPIAAISGSKFILR